MSRAMSKARTSSNSWPLRYTSRPRSGLLIDFSLLLAMLLSSLGQTLVATALPRIVADLQCADRYVWAVTACMLCST